MKDWDFFPSADQNTNNHMRCGLPPGPMGMINYDHNGWGAEKRKNLSEDGFFSSGLNSSVVQLKNGPEVKPPSVQRYENARQRLELEVYQSNNLLMPGYHVYTVNTEICTLGTKGCTEQAVFDQLRRFPAPQRFGAPDRTVGVKTGDRSFALAVGYVVHWVGRRMLTNTTIENRHLLNPGVVLREVVTVGNKIVVRTSGYGMGVLPQINSGEAAELIWSHRTDSKIKAAIRKQASEAS